MEKVVKAAIDAMENTYSPYSKFAVGAALLMKDGSIISGANIENASFGLTNCAERSAMFAAYSQGYRKDDIISIAVAGKTEEPISPCGACRQVMLELMNHDAPVYMINKDGKVKETTVSGLMPYAFTEIE